MTKKLEVTKKKLFLEVDENILDINSANEEVLKVDEIKFLLMKAIMERQMMLVNHIKPKRAGKHYELWKIEGKSSRRKQKTSYTDNLNDFLSRKQMPDNRSLCSRILANRVNLWRIRNNDFLFNASTGCNSAL